MDHLNGWIDASPHRKHADQIKSFIDFGSSNTLAEVRFCIRDTQCSTNVYICTAAGTSSATMDLYSIEHKINRFIYLQHPENITSGDVVLMDGYGNPREIVPYKPIALRSLKEGMEEMMQHSEQYFAEAAPDSIDAKKLKPKALFLLGKIVEQMERIQNLLDNRWAHFSGKSVLFMNACCLICFLAVNGGLRQSVSSGMKGEEFSFV